VESQIRRYGYLRIKASQTIEEESRQLKQMYAELSPDHKILKDIVAKKL